MSPREIKNVAASVHDRLLNLARRQGEEMQRVLGRYTLERLLYRLGESSHADRFALKGAFLFQTWEKGLHRQTRDLDLLGLGPTSAESIENVFRDVFGLPAPDDGLDFDAESLNVAQIREQTNIVGFRVKAMAYLGTARIPLQVDIGFDAVTETLETIAYPTLLDHDTPRIQAYPMELVVAEKTEAILKHGLLNSRLKDYFDLHHLAANYSFEGTQLRNVFAQTLTQRATIIPDGPIEGLGDVFSQDPAKQAQWRSFLSRIGQPDANLVAVVETVSEFVLPVLEAIREDRTFEFSWPSGGPWGT